MKQLHSLPLAIALFFSCVQAQIRNFPYTENFDSVTAPALPSGWITSTQRLATGDFVTTTSSPRSLPNAALSVNSTVPQFLITPRFDFTGRLPDKLQYWTSRSLTHTSGVLVEASTDNGISFPIILSDTLRNPGNTAYNLISLNLPPSLNNQSHVRFRWRILGGIGGTTGTFRIDDIALTVKTTIDLAVESFSMMPLLPLISDTITFSVLIRNLGIHTATNYFLELFDDANRDSIGQPGERFRQISPPPINAGDSLNLQVQWTGFSAGEHQILAVASTPGDENPANNRAILNFVARLTPRSVVINEIMYAPISGQAEWVELYNRSSSPVDLSNWTLSDMRDARGKSNIFTLAKTATRVAPGGYAVVSSDSSILSLYSSLRTPPSNVTVLILNRSSLSLSNEGDDVIITDPVGTVIDSVRYSPSWHNPELSSVSGISLERINPSLSSNDRRNWNSSVNKLGGTPGQQNSIYTTSLPSQTTISISPNPFSPDGDGFEDFAVISYQLPTQTARIRLKVFDSVGRLVRTLASNELSGSTGQIIWDGLDDEKRRLRMGIYVILLEAFDSGGGTVESAKAAAVVAGKL